VSPASPKPASEALAPLAAHKTALLTTFKRSGEPVSTPVTIAVDGDRAFFRTYDRSWKARRLRRNPEVEAAPSTSGGKPRGPAIHGRARLLDSEGEEAADARRLIARRSPFLQGIAVPALHRLRGYRTLHYELEPGPMSSPTAG
jgi:uncharacterized protein